MVHNLIESSDGIEQISYMRFEFEAVLVNRFGEVTERQTHNAKQYVENLGNSVFLEMVVIPGGSFLMGSQTGSGYEDESPQHRVDVSSFLIGRYPVTQEQWEAVMGWIPPYRCRGPRRPHVWDKNQ
jgi:formylglycine-generating enzyme required for sulfatase activity